MGSNPDLPPTYNSISQNQIPNPPYTNLVSQMNKPDTEIPKSNPSPFQFAAKKQSLHNYKKYLSTIAKHPYHLNRISLLNRANPSSHSYLVSSIAGSKRMRSQESSNVKQKVRRNARIGSANAKAESSKSRVISYSGSLLVNDGAAKKLKKGSDRVPLNSDEQHAEANEVFQKRFKDLYDSKIPIPMHQQILTEEEIWRCHKLKFNLDHAVYLKIMKIDQWPKVLYSDECVGEVGPGDEVLVNKIRDIALLGDGGENVGLQKETVGYEDCNAEDSIVSNVVVVTDNGLELVVIPNQPSNQR